MGDTWSKRVVDDDGNVHRYSGEKGAEEHNHIIYNSSGDMIYCRTEDATHANPEYDHRRDTAPTQTEAPRRVGN